MVRKNRIKGERKGEAKSVKCAFPTRQQLQRTICHHLPSSSLLHQFTIIGKYAFLYLVVNQFYLVSSCWYNCYYFHIFIVQVTIALCWESLMDWSTTRGNRIKGERKGDRYQSSGHLRHGNSWSALSVTNSIRHRITSSQSWVYILFFTWWFALTFWFKLLTFINLNFWILVNMLKIINCLVNYGVVLLLGVVSLMARSTTGVLMSPGYGGYQTTTSPPPTQHQHT